MEIYNRAMRAEEEDAFSCVSFLDFSREKKANCCVQEILAEILAELALRIWIIF